VREVVAKKSVLVKAVLAIAIQSVCRLEASSERVHSTVTDSNDFRGFVKGKIE